MLSHKRKRVLLACLLLVAAVILTVGDVGAAGPGGEKYPEKAITMIAAISPGGGVDLAARVLANALSKEWGVPVNVVNKPGGAMVTGVLEMLKSAPDGYTVLADNAATASYHVVLPDLPFKIGDRTYLGGASTGSQALTVNAKLPWKDLRDVAAAAKKNPEKFKWGSLGGVTVADLALQQFFAEAGVDLPRTKNVRFTGAGPAMIALAGGHIDFTSGGVPAVLSYVQAGLARVVAVTGPSKHLPEVKTAVEQGYQKVTSKAWQGYTGPVGVPKSVVTIWEQTLKKVTNSPEYKEQIEKIGFYSSFMSSDEMKQRALEDAESAKKFLRMEKE